MYAGELNVQVSQFSDLIGFPDCFSSPINSNLPLYQDLWPVDSDVGRDQVAKDIFIHLIDKVLKKLSILHSGHWQVVPLCKDHTSSDIVLSTALNHSN